VPAKGQEARLYTLPLHFEKVLEGSHGGESQPDRDIPRYVRLYESGKLRLNELISCSYSLEKLNDAIADMRAGAFAGRCMIRMQD